MFGASIIAHIPYFNAPHWVAIVMTPLVPIVLWGVLKSHEDDKWKNPVAYILAGLLFLHEIAYRVFHYATCETITEFLHHSLPINICPLALFAGLIALCRRSQLAYEIAYFWGFAAALNSILTPDITWPFPSFGFFGYFVSHCGVIWAILYATLVLKMRPEWKSIWRAFGALNVAVIILAAINIVLGGANYAFLLEAPEADTPFFFVPWPRYIPVLGVLSVGMFTLAYLPFHFLDRWKSNRVADSEGRPNTEV